MDAEKPAMTLLLECRDMLNKYEPQKSAGLRSRIADCLAKRALAAPPSSGNWRVGTNISMRYALNQLDASVLDGMFFRFSCPTPQIAADVVTLLNAAPPKLTREQVYYAVRDSGRSDPSRREAITDEIMRLLGVDAPQEGR